MVSFEHFLKKVRKSNGDQLLPITIEKYLYFVSEYEKDFCQATSVEDLIVLMNSIVKRRPSIVIYSSFRMYLLYKGVVKKSVLIKSLLVPDTNANAFKSKRFLQSKVLSRGELKRIYDESTAEEKFLFSALYDTACRRSELLNIKYSDIIFHDDEGANIHAEVSVLGKGSKSRVVYFGATTVNLLRSLRPDIESDDIVFLMRKKDGSLYKNQAQALYEFIVKKIDKVLERRITPHAFRHTKLSHLADSGADALGLQKYAGHENIATTMIYLEISNRLGKVTYETYSKDIVFEGEAV